MIFRSLKERRTFRADTDYWISVRNTVSLKGVFLSSVAFLHVWPCYIALPVIAWHTTDLSLCPGSLSQGEPGVIRYLGECFKIEINTLSGFTYDT